MIGHSNQFLVPVYQRKYSWKPSNCKTLLRDIRKTGSDTEIPDHFLGTIVCILAEDYAVSGVTKLSVIDGQQRLTTLLLLLSALDKLLETKPSESLTKEDLTSMLSNPTKKGDLNRKLILTQKDDQTLNQVLDGIQLTEPFSKNIKDNYSYFLKELGQPGVNLEDIILGIRKLKVVIITLKIDQDDPQKIFESLNATGVDLTPAEQIKNFLLMGLSQKEQEDLYKKYWLPMEDKITSHFDDFMKDFLTMKRIDIPTVKTVYSTFKEYFYDPDEKNDNAKCVEELLYYSQFYEIIALQKTQDKEILDAVTSFGTYALRSTVVYPFLLQVFSDQEQGRISKSDVLEIMNLIQSYIFRRQICELSPSAYARIFARLYSSIPDPTDKNTYVDFVKAALLTLPAKQKFPTDDEFFEKLRSRDVYLMKTVCGYMLMKLENKRRKKEQVNILGAVPSDANATIEHILPQNTNLKQCWQDQLGSDWRQVQQKCVNKLGNLTITELNSELSDDCFPDKVTKAYKNSIYWLTRNVKDLTDWDESQITKRTAELAKLSQEIWTYPVVPDEILDKVKDKATEISEAETWDEARSNASDEVKVVQDELTQEIQNKFSSCYIEPHPSQPLLYFYVKQPLEIRNCFMVMDCHQSVFNVSYRIDPNSYVEQGNLKDNNGKPKIKLTHWYFRNKREIGKAEAGMGVSREDIPLVLTELEHAYMVTDKELNYST